jgi:MFS family permease
MQKRVEENLILSSLKESVRTIKKKKTYFAVLFVVQLAFLLVISAVFMHYSIKIGEDAQKVIEPLGNVSASLSPADTSTLLKQSAPVYEAYNRLVSNVLMFLFLSFILYMFLNGVVWDIANLMVNEKSPFIRYQLMFGVSAFVFTFIALLFGGFFLRFLTYIGNNQIALILEILLCMAITYFAFISFGLINRYDTSQIKDFLKHAVFLGYKKFWTLIFSYLLMLLVISLFGGLIYFLLYSAMPALILSAILFILALIWGKIFFLTVVRKVAEEVKYGNPVKILHKSA